ncbi:MAG: hypothetical protein JNJ54_16385 [Myxococcaceae bacterium]|nr:hypothetical protein [Myxococcaceae bacterium]
MFARLAIVMTSLLAGSVHGAMNARVYAVSWSQVDASPERTALIGEVDRQLRDELRRRGATVIDGDARRASIVLKPSLEVLPGGLKLSLVSVRAADQKLLGAISTKASGASQKALVRALVARTCNEATQLE